MSDQTDIVIQILLKDVNNRFIIKMNAIRSKIIASVPQTIEEIKKFDIKICFGKIATFSDNTEILNKAINDHDENMKKWLNKYNGSINKLKNNAINYSDQMVDVIGSLFKSYINKIFQYLDINIRDNISNMNYGIRAGIGTLSKLLNLLNIFDTEYKPPNTGNKLILSGKSLTNSKTLRNTLIELLYPAFKNLNEWIKICKTNKKLQKIQNNQKIGRMHVDSKSFRNNFREYIYRLCNTQRQIIKDAINGNDTNNNNKINEIDYNNLIPNYFKLSTITDDNEDDYKMNNMNNIDINSYLHVEGEITIMEGTQINENGFNDVVYGSIVNDDNHNSNEQIILYDKDNNNNMNNMNIDYPPSNIPTTPLTNTTFTSDNNSRSIFSQSPRSKPITPIISIPTIVTNSLSYPPFLDIQNCQQCVRWKINQLQYENQYLKSQISYFQYYLRQQQIPFNNNMNNMNNINTTNHPKVAISQSTATHINTTSTNNNDESR